MTFCLLNLPPDLVHLATRSNLGPRTFKYFTTQKLEKAQLCAMKHEGSVSLFTVYIYVYIYDIIYN